MGKGNDERIIVWLWKHLHFRFVVKQCFSVETLLASWAGMLLGIWHPWPLVMPLINCDHQKCPPPHFQIPLGSWTIPNWEALGTSHKGACFSSVTFSCSGAGRKRAEIWIDECWVWQTRTVTGGRGRRTDGVCHGLIMIDLLNNKVPLLAQGNSGTQQWWRISGYYS